MTGIACSAWWRATPKSANWIASSASWECSIARGPGTVPVGQGLTQLQPALAGLARGEQLAGVLQGMARQQQCVQGDERVVVSAERLQPLQAVAPLGVRVEADQHPGLGGGPGAGLDGQGGEQPDRLGTGLAR